MIKAVDRFEEGGKVTPHHEEGDAAPQPHDGCAVSCAGGGVEVGRLRQLPPRLAQKGEEGHDESHDGREGRQRGDGVGQACQGPGRAWD